jgi:hypothetical protein
LSALIAASASAAAISTKPNPRERPLSRSVTTLTDSTVPWSVKSRRSWSSVAVKAQRGGPIS